MQKYRVVLEVEIVLKATSLNAASRLAERFVKGRLRTEGIVMPTPKSVRHVATDPEEEE